MKQSGVVSDDFKPVESHDCPMSTYAAPAGSPCRTGKGKVAIQYHTARFRLVPQLAKALGVPTPALRKPGSALPVNEVLADPQPDDDPARSQRPFIQHALVRAVYASRVLTAAGAPAGASGGHRLHHKDVGGVGDALHSYIDPIGSRLT